MSREIRIVPFGEVDETTLTYLGGIVAAQFGRDCRTGAAQPLPEGAYDPRRKQYAAETFLYHLHPGDAERVLGVADLDLYVPQLNFVFGLSDGAGRRAVIALPRLRESFYGAPDDESLFLERAAKEAVHELGHTYGLGHCQDRRCVMVFSNSLADTNYKGKEFCARCRKRLRL